MTLLMIQDELGLNRELMFKLPPEKRWELYLSKQKVNNYCSSCELGLAVVEHSNIVISGHSLTQKTAMLTNVTVD